jgi:hypothetical protein
MNKEYEALLAALQSIMGGKVDPSKITTSPGNLMSAGSGRAMTEAERRARGIDPRDPNQYSILPNGNVVGTLMGWAGMGDKLPPEQIEQMWAQRGNVSSPSIPRATPNKYGMTRLSAGMYRDKSGNVVRSKTGAPAPMKTNETAKAGTRG